MLFDVFLFYISRLINPLTNQPINQAYIFFEAGETRSAYRLTPWDTFHFEADSRSTGQEIYRMELRCSFPCKEEAFSGSYTFSQTSFFCTLTRYISVRSRLTVTFQYRVCVTNYIFLSGFVTEILFDFLSQPCMLRLQRTLFSSVLFILMISFEAQT